MTISSNKIFIASRASELAIRQSQIVVELLHAEYPGLDVEILEVTTKGDRDQRPFADIGGKGLFTSEVERRVIDAEVDIAVHSAKDLTGELGPGCVIACVPQRASAHDVVVGGSGPTGEERLASLPPGSTVGTSSMRRRSLLAEWRDDLETVELRGNLGTRLRKVAEGQVDAAILAAAGLERLGITEGANLDPSRWIPPPGQGTLAVEALERRVDVLELLAPLDDPSVRAALEAERAFSRRLEGGCSVPLGCHASLMSGRLLVNGFLGTIDGASTFRDRISGPPEDAVALGTELAEAILAAGGDDILEELKDATAPPVEAP